MNVALLFSGQGAQTVGMGRALAEEFPTAGALIRQADETLGRSLSSVMFEGPEPDLTQTATCQPALYVHGLAALAAVRELVPELRVTAAAGLSLGEFTAHAAAGTYSFETGLRIVAQRGQLMQEACDASSGAMAAMIGADETSVRNLAANTDVDVANLNSPGQIVISGETSKVALAVSLAKEHGIRRATMLNVAGAYHSRLMQPAYLKLGELLQQTELHDPAFPVITNVDARPSESIDGIRRSLQEQVTSTVRWTESMEYLIDELECDMFLELGPGKVLAGLMGRIRKDVTVLSIEDPAGVRSAADVLKLERGT
jgi:[acyl-carrier-protein] S-malonyltransferase